MDYVLKVEVPHYIRKIKISEEQRPKYYTWNGKTIKSSVSKVNLKYLKMDFRIKDIDITPEMLDHGYYLAVKVNNEFHILETTMEANKYIHLNPRLCKYNNGKINFIVANFNTVGTPTFQIIRGQDLYSGNMNEYTRAKVMKAIKIQLYDCMQDFTPIDINKRPFILLCEIHDTVLNQFEGGEAHHGQDWDVGNRAFPYMKAFPDFLKENGVIPDDNRLIITGEQFLFYPIEDFQQRKLVFYLIQDLRQVIKDCPDYQGSLSKEKKKVIKSKKRSVDLERITGVKLNLKKP